MAVRSLREREVFLDARIRTTARHAVKAVESRIRERLDDDLADLRMELTDFLSHGGRGEEIGGAVGSLESSRPLIGRVYVFMNPWGFVYPSSETPARARPQERDAVSTGGRDSAEALVQALRPRIASAESWRDTVCLTFRDASYCFSRLSERRGLYAGFKVDDAGLRRLLADALESFSGAGLRLYAEGPGLARDAAISGAERPIVVRDSLESMEGARVEAAGTGGEDTAVLANGRLPPPLDHIRIVARAVDTAAWKEAQQFRLRLQGWGIVLLLGVVLIGIAAVVGEAAREVREARSRSDFVLGVSHDLRTPISSVKMMAESLLAERVRDKEKRRRFLQVMVRESERLNQLIERVLFFVRYGQRALVFHPRLCDPGELVAEAVDAFRSRFLGMDGPASDAEERVRLSVEPDLPRVKADAGAVAQVLLNLLDNAWKYSQCPENASPIDVRVRGVLRRRLGRPGPRLFVAIDVQDRGVGMTRREKRRVFRKFYRGAAAARSNVSGVGMGLAVCRHVVHSHGGRIEVQSVPGQGSTFTVYLPAVGDIQ